MDGSIEMLWFL